MAAQVFVVYAEVTLARVDEIECNRKLIGRLNQDVPHHDTTGRCSQRPSSSPHTQIFSRFGETDSDDVNLISTVPVASFSKRAFCTT